MKKYSGLLLMGLSLFSCGAKKEKADLIVHNAKVYTVNAGFETCGAFVIKDGKFLETGDSEALLAKYEAAETIDAQGKAVYPGFHDAHCHLLGLGNYLSEADLVGTKSFEEITQKVTAFAKSKPHLAWIKGRGWDQNDWDTKEFPTKDKLDKLFPDRPVFLVRIDGHAALVNQKALDLAGVTASTVSAGGLVETKNGQLTGILVDNAMELVGKKIPAASETETAEALKAGEKECFRYGLTTLHDAGLPKPIIDQMGGLQQKGDLKIRVYAMAADSPENLMFYLNNGPVKTDRLNVRSFKVYADGALGSRGACLLAPYGDKPETSGFLLNKPEVLKELAEKIYAGGFQMNTHCIGDSANRQMLDIYAGVLGGKNDKRWRIEHAQVVNKNDFAKFGQNSVIPSVQPTHCTSDMYWALDRLGKPRADGAYAYKDLLAQNQTLALGSDFPIEQVSPLFGFHSAVARQDAKQFPAGGFQPENAIDRQSALKGMTIWAAYAAFEENEKGSIEAGKFADFVILEEDIMEAPQEKLRDVKVLATYVNGEKVFGGQ